jgi:DNA repair ATPase RecN
MSKKSKKIYCGVEELNEKQKRGTSKECAELKQIRYYGLHKVSKDVAEEFKGIPVESELKEKRLAKMMGLLRGKIERYKDEINDYKEEDDYKKNKNYQKAVKELEEKIKEAKEKLVKVSKKMKDFREKKNSKK